MSTAHPALRRAGLGAVAGAVAGSLVALQGLRDWPTLGTAAIILSPVPIVLAAAQAGRLGTATSLGVTAVVVGVIPLGVGMPAWAVVLGYGSIVGYVLLVARNMQHVNAMLFAGVALAIALAVLQLTLEAWRHERTLGEEYEATVRQAGEVVIANLGMESVDPERREQMEQVLPTIQRLLPAIAVSQLLTSLLFSTWICLFALRRVTAADIPRMRFGAWRLPEWFVFCFLVPAAGLLFALRQGYEGLATISGNILAIVVCILFAHGCAILHAFLRRAGARPFVEAMVFVSVLLLSPPLPLLLVVAGLFDFLVDFRGRWTPASSAPGERPEG